MFTVDRLFIVNSSLVRLIVRKLIRNNLDYGGEA
jgi:hypothetical protein